MDIYGRLKTFMTQVDSYLWCPRQENTWCGFGFNKDGPIMDGSAPGQHYQPSLHKNPPNSNKIFNPLTGSFCTSHVLMTSQVVKAAKAH